MKFAVAVKCDSPHRGDPFHSNARMKKWRIYGRSAIFPRWLLGAISSRTDLSGLRKYVHGAQQETEILFTLMRGHVSALAGIPQEEILPALWQDIRNSHREEHEWRPCREILFA